MSTVVSLNRQTKQGKQKTKKLEMKLNPEDMNIVLTLESLKVELDFLHNNLDYITEPALIDSCIYEIKATHMKYNYYLQECKKRGLIADAV